jgi:hypothetical protein
MTRKKKILIAISVALVAIQFIRPAKNISDLNGPNEIAKHYTVPENVQNILKQSCYDCHSNNTNYPWYTNIQPVGLWIQLTHVNDGKRHLNFSEYGSYPEKKAKHKFEEIADEVREGEMPLGTYTLIHGDAKLSSEQTKALVDWADALK